MAAVAPQAAGSRLTGAGPEPRAAIVIPAYQAEGLIGGCLEALRGVPARVARIVVDDGSTDGTGAVAAAAGARVVRHARNRGTSAARNTGWRLACAPEAAGGAPEAEGGAAEIVVFVDADVRVRPGSVERLIARLAAEPELLGVNGILAVDGPQPDRVTAFVNTSIHYQHLRHGSRVASAFTSICALRRGALEEMGGWDERFAARYADDVATRWVLPPGSLGLEAGAQADHEKRVGLRGLLRHRANIGYHFVQSVRLNRAAARAAPGRVVLGWRYPANTALAAGTAGVVAGGILFWPLWGLAGLPLAGFVLVNARFAAFVWRERGAAEALIAVPLSALEGFAYASGMARAAILP